LSNLDGASTGCALNAGVVSFTAVGTCIIDFNDPSSGASDAYTSAVQVKQSFSVAAPSGGGGGGGGGGGRDRDHVLARALEELMEPSG
jgi:hypothetical protein